MSESINFVGINNTKLVNKLKENGDRLLPDREYIISVGSGKTGPEISFRLFGSENVTLSYIDFLILDTAQLFFEWPLSEKYGRRFTLRKFIRVMTGDECSEPAQISPKRLEYIRSRIEHLSNVNIYIDMTNENRRISEKGDVPPHPTGILKTRFFPLHMTRREGTIISLRTYFRYMNMLLLTDRSFVFPPKYFSARAS